MNSIRRRLILALVGTVSTALLAVGIAIYSTAQQEVGDMFDYHLRQIALSLQEAAFSGVWVPPPETEAEQFDYVIQIWNPVGIGLYISSPHRLLPGFAGEGLANVKTSDGQSWRVFGIRSRHQIVQIAQTLKIRNRMALKSAMELILPLMLLLPALAVMIWFIVSHGLSPLDRLAKALASRTPTALEPLSQEAIPEEVLPLVDALNDLLKRLDKALHVQRDFIADAAHELRTPITALQLQAQLAKRASDEYERSTALADLEAGARRVSRTVQQLLTLARMEPEQAGNQLQEVELVDLARMVVAEQSPLAREKNIDLGLIAPETGVVILGERESLKVLLSNLVENAIRYTPKQGRVDVSTGTDDAGPWLKLTDTGPGIPEKDQARVFDRFYRGENTTEPGTGLGLSIVKAVADRHDARIEMHNLSAMGGLSTKVLFPRPEALTSS